MFKKATETQMINWISLKNLDPLGKYLISSTVHGQPGIPVGELARVIKTIRKNCTPEETYELAKKLLKRTEYTARRMGLSLLSSGWPNKEVENLLLKAADDSDWQVRETAAGAFATFLEIDFKHFTSLFEKWNKSQSDNVKRAISLAIKYDSRTGDQSKWKNYFKLLDPLMTENSEYIRKNLGPFTIGDGLLSKFPEQTLAACKIWVKSKNENTRWNTAMIFTAASAKRYSLHGKTLLAPLENDASVFVAKAFQKAMKNLKSVPSK